MRMSPQIVTPGPLLFRGVIPFLPDSINVLLGDRLGASLELAWSRWRARITEIRRILEPQIRQAGTHVPIAVPAELHLVFHHVRRRDLGNPEKQLMDALKGLVITDDYSFIYVGQRRFKSDLDQTTLYITRAL